MSVRSVPLAVLMTAAALTLTPACSTTKPLEPATSTTPAPATTSPPPQAHGVYEQCLTQHGVPSPAAGPPPGPGLEPQGPIPGPPDQSTPGSTTRPPPPPGLDEITWDNAVTACASLRPTPPMPTP